MKKNNRKNRNKLNNKNIFMLFVLIVIIGICTKNVFAIGDRPTQEYIVENNDTLWSIAKNIVNGSENKSINIQRTVYEIKKMNKLESSDIFEGQSIIIPIY